MDNRKTRRAKLSAFKKELKNAKFDEFEKVDDMGKFPSNLGEFKGFWKNSIYSVQVYFRDNCSLLGIRRHDQKPICPWSHKQKIKNIFFSEEVHAVEVFPKEECLTDEANIYWLWASNDVQRVVDELGGLSSYKKTI